MSVINWEIVTKENALNGVDFTVGLQLEGDFCYATEVTAGPSFIAIKNKVITNKKNSKIRAMIRKSCNNMEPFLFLRLHNNEAYVMKMESNISIYKLNFSSGSAFSIQDPISSGTTLIEPNKTYNVSFSCYELLDGSTIFDVDILNSYGVWENEIKEVLTPDIAEGDMGFGNYYRFSNLTSDCKRVFYDRIEILTPVEFI